MYKNFLLHEAVAVLCSMIALRHFVWTAQGHRRRRKALLRRMLCLMRIAESSVSCWSVTGIIAERWATYSTVK
jgi:hypothetical protein